MVKANIVEYVHVHLWYRPKIVIFEVWCDPETTYIQKQ